MRSPAVALRLLALLLALGGVALGALIAGEVALIALGRPPLTPYADLVGLARDTSARGGAAVAFGAGLAVLGLLLLVLALRPGRRRGLPVVASTPDVTTAVHRDGLRRRLQAEAVRVEGVRSARVTVGRRQVRVQATAGVRDTADLAAQVQQRLATFLSALDLQRPLSVRATVARRTA